MAAMLDAILNFYICTNILKYLFIYYESYVIAATFNMQHRMVNVIFSNLFSIQTVGPLLFYTKMAAILDAIFIFSLTSLTIDETLIYSES